VSETAGEENGAAMVVAILVVTVLALSSATVVAVASRDVLATRRETAVFIARSAAESALDAFAARAGTDAGFVDAAAQRPVEADRWMRADAYGSPTPCQEQEDMCAVTIVKAVTLAPGDTERKVSAAVVEATGRGGCRAAPRCTYVRVQQRLQRRTFFDFLVQTDYELMDPSLLPEGDAPGQAGWQRAHCEHDGSGRRLGALERPTACVVPAWFGSGAAALGDDVRGPVHTNDDRIPHCGNPTFRGPVETTGSAGDASPPSMTNTFVSEERSVPACGPPAKPESAPVLAGPEAVLRKAPFILLPPDAEHLDRAASGGHGLRWPASGDGPLASADVTLKPNGRVDVERRGSDGDTVCACDQPTPDSGVVFVDAPVLRVKGSSPFPVTIATSGTLIVDGDVGVTADAVPAAGIGLLARGPVRLQMADRGTNVVRDRVLDQVALVSLDHTVVTDRWDDPTVCAPACPTLRFTGAIVGRYRPVIGSYDTATGLRSGGYAKSMQHAPELAVAQPPYMLVDGQAPWVRVDAVETGAGTPGLRP